jgi:EAL domain-containing protein (putative c-di-GMP-specific phosphodiesterase class I)
LRVWQERFGGNHPLTISINVSVKQLSGDRFATHLARTLGETGLAAGDVHIELTESAVMEDMADSLATLARLRASGVELHIDDFGTGHSSLSYPRQLQVDRVKIDRSFVSRDGQNGLADREIIDTIVSLSHKLGIEVVAEGVESEQQRLELRALRCGYAQGYFFSRVRSMPPPMPTLPQRCPELRFRDAAARRGARTRDVPTRVVGCVRQLTYVEE